MAKAKKSSKPSSGSNPDSNTGLIVTLVFFVLATLTLGVFTYLGYSGQAELVEKEKKAQNDLKAAKKSLDEESVRRAVLAIASGNESTDDQKKLASLKGGNDAAFKAVTGALKELPKWEPGLDRPNETYVDVIGKLRKDLETARNEKRTAEGNLAEARTAHDTERKNLLERNNKLADELKQAQAKALEDLNKSRADYIALIDKIDKELSEGLKNEKQNRADDNAAADRDRKKLADVIAGLKEQVAKRDSLIAPPNSLESDTPKGKILRVDRAARTVYLNLGSADFLKPQVTFSVWGPNTSGKAAAGKEPKGHIEIINVVEPHMSIGRIVSVNSELRDPLLPGDLLFNPSWNSSQREHIALLGIFDLDGDGRDDTAELIRNLERQGIVVDAWVDLQNRTMKGTGLTERTTYLVLGEMPKLSESLARQRAQLGDNPIVQAYEQVSAKIAEVQALAKEKGVQTVAYRRYLTLVGYQLPKLTRPLDASLSSYLRPSLVGSGDGAGSSEEKPK